MTAKDEKWMGEALKLAQAAKADGELPFGAVVVLGGQIVAKGRCREAKLKTVLAHAEAEAIDVACKHLATNNLSDCKIYCTNEPCIMCAAAIFQAKVPEVYIGASRSDIPSLRPREISIDLLAKDSGYDIKIVRGLRKDEIIAFFSTY